MWIVSLNAVCFLSFTTLNCCVLQRLVHHDICVPCNHWICSFSFTFWKTIERLTFPIVVSHIFCEFYNSNSLAFRFTDCIDIPKCFHVYNQHRMLKLLFTSILFFFPNFSSRWRVSNGFGVMKHTSRHIISFQLTSESTSSHSDLGSTVCLNLNKYFSKTQNFFFFSIPSPCATAETMTLTENYISSRVPSQHRQDYQHHCSVQNRSNNYSRKKGREKWVRWKYCERQSYIQMSLAERLGLEVSKGSDSRKWSRNTYMSDISRMLSRVKRLKSTHNTPPEQ